VGTLHIQVAITQP